MGLPAASWSPWSRSWGSAPSGELKPSLLPPCPSSLAGDPGSAPGGGRVQEGEHQHHGHGPRPPQGLPVLLLPQDDHPQRGEALSAAPKPREAGGRGGGRAAADEAPRSARIRSPLPSLNSAAIQELGSEHSATGVGAVVYSKIPIIFLNHGVASGARAK